jgi:prophage antirepressor-like protein
MELLTVVDNTEQIFLFDNNKVRVVGDVKDNPMFIASDVCKILELSNVSHALSTILDKWKGTVIVNTTGGKQEMFTVNEAGLYKLIMKSKKKVAEKFQEWVCEDVLPSLRKKGEYIVEEYKKKLDEIQSKLDNEENLVTRLRRSVSNHSKKYHFYHSFREMPAVYIISDPSKINQSELKIGFTDNINQRLKSDRCMIPNLRLEFLMYCHFASDFEKSIKMRFREQFINPNHEWLIESLDKVINSYREINKALMYNAIEELECWKYNMEEKENQEEIKEIKEESEEDNSEEEKNFALGPKKEILSARTKKLLTKWLIKSDYDETNNKAPHGQRYCNGWCASYQNLSEFRAIRSGGLLSICKGCENKEEIARVKIEQEKYTVEQIKANPNLLLCRTNEKICRQCLQVKDAEQDYEPNNRKCRECKSSNTRQKESKSNINFQQTIDTLTNFVKDLSNSPTELKTKIKTIRKCELILILSELKLGRSKDDVKDDMINKVYKYFLTIRNP